MKPSTKKLIKAMLCILGGWCLGAVQFFVFAMVNDFSAKAKFIPAVFSAGAVVLLVLYLIYWAKAKKDPNLNSMRILMLIVGCVVAMACIVLNFVFFSNVLRSQLVTITAVIEGALLLIGQILAYILGEVRIGK